MVPDANCAHDAIVAQDAIGQDTIGHGLSDSAGEMNVFTDKINDLTVEDEAREGLVPGPRPTRRLSDKILVAFHQACDTAELDVADQLLRVLEFMTNRKPTYGDGNRRRNMESLVAAYERLWHLRHPRR